MGGGQPTVEVTSDGHGLVSHVGSALLAQAAASKTWWWCSPTAAIACLTWPHSRPGRPVRSARRTPRRFGWSIGSPATHRRWGALSRRGRCSVAK